MAEEEKKGVNDNRGISKTDWSLFARRSIEGESAETSQKKKGERKGGRIASY